MRVIVGGARTDGAWNARGGSSAMEVFLREPRDEAFARPREELLRRASEGVKKKISPDLDLDVVCRTTTCRVVVRFKTTNDVEDISSRLQMIPWGDPVTLTMEHLEGTRVMTFYGLPGGSMSAIAVHEDWLRKAGVID